MADCVSLIQSNLETLKTFEKNIASHDNEGSISDILKKIHDVYVNYNLKVQERDIANAYLLCQDSGILSSLKAFLCLKDFRSIKIECFKLLDDIIELSSQRIQEYGDDIQCVCLLYVKRDVHADIKKACLITVSKVLEACRGFQGKKKIKPEPLIETLFLQLCRSKISSKVKEEILCLIGIIAHYYPEDFLVYQERVLHMYLQELKTQIKLKVDKIDYYTIAGCLQGLKEYLYNFPVLCSEDQENSYFIYDVARKMAVESEKFLIKSTSGKKSSTSTSACKAGLQMIAAHAPLFSQFVFEDCKNLYEKLVGWVEQDNRDMQKLGRDAVIAVLRQTSDTIMKEYINDENYCKRVFMFFMEEFREIFLKSDTNINARKLHIAVIGYGHFAGPCKLCLPESEVKRMLQNIIQKSEYEFFSDNKNINDNIMVLPSYIESVASILSNIDFIPENILFEVEKLVIFQIDKFPKVPSAYNFIVPKSLIYVLVALQPKEELFVEFLSEIVYQGLVRTCSHPVVIEAENIKDKIVNKDENSSDDQYGKEPNVKIETYKDYMYLWKNILNVVQLKELSALNIPLQERQYLMECLYDQLIRSSLDLISKLDLTLQQKIKQDNMEGMSDDDDDDVSSDFFHGIKPNNREDYYIFLNIVEFLRDLLIDSCNELFTKWVYIFGREMIYFATLHPYHSGFYKLISLNLSICNKIDYFKDIPICKKSHDSIKVENVVWESYYLFSKFIKEIIIRLQQFKDDLLASCLEVLLALPTEIVQEEIHVLIPALEIALKLGMSYLPLAINAVSALEKWSDSVPLEKLKPYFPKLLPHLNIYITASGFHDACSIPLLKVSKPSKKVHKMSTKSVKKKRHSPEAVIDDPEFQKLQLKIIKFLGRLGENNSAILENTFENIDKVAIAWDSVYRNHLKYAVPFVDMKPEIYFDDFLPRVLEVATKSSVRQVKVAACEALHSLVLYMIGRGSQMPEDLQVKFSMEAIYKNIFPGLLELACDVEEVAKQLFHPLVFQIIHWFTHSKVIKTPESSVILQSLWNGVTHKENTSLRDLSAVCLKEYFQWFLKQATQEKKNLIESLLNKLSSFSLHPNPYKRMGAALTFNNIYKIFRTEESLVKNYTIQLLVQFIDSLAIAHNDDKSLGTQKQCIIALEHVEKIVIVKYNYFLKPSLSAKVPSCLEDSSLKSVVQWILLQCGCIQTECRRKCMDLVVKLSTLIPGVKDSVSFLLDYKVDEKNIFEDIFERALRSKSDFSDLKSFKSLSFWLEALLASLECYHWAFSDQLLLQKVLDGENHSYLLSSVKIFNITNYFLANVAKGTLLSTTRLSIMNTIGIYTPEEELKYNSLKCSVLVRLMSFISSVFNESAKWFHEKFFKTLWNPDLWEVLMLCTVQPSSIGFDMNDPEIFTNLPKEMSELHKNCLSKRKDFQEYCHKFLLQEKYYLPKMLPLTLKHTKEDPLRLIQIFIGYEQLISHGLWSPKYSPGTSEAELIGNLLCSVASISRVKDSTTNQKIGSNPVVTTIAEKLLLLAYALGLKVEDLAITLQNKRDSIYRISEPLIFANFAKNLCDFVSKNPLPFIQTLVDSLNHTSFTEIAIILKFIDYVARTKILRKKYGKKVVEALLLCWNSICSWSKNHPDVDSIYSLLSLMQKMLLIDSEVALNTSGTFLMSLYPTYLSLLKKEDINFNFIVQAFNILPFFLESDKTDLRECLEQIIATHFPLMSAELKHGSSSYHTYISALKKLFTALLLTGCNFLLEILTVLICKESSHVLEDEFKKSIIQMVKRTKLDKQHLFADFIFNIAMKEKCSLKSEILLAILEKVLVSLIQRCETSSFINFYLKHIKTIMAILKGSCAAVGEDIKIVKKIYGFRLVEILYGRLSKDLLHTKESQIVETYLGFKPTNGNELTTEVTKLCMEFKRTSYENEPIYKELYRKLNCACYNTLIAVVACTQKDVKFYNVFLFKENPVKNERIWERIINKDLCLKFDMELDESLHRQKKFVTMRHQIRTNSGEQGNSSGQIPSSLQLLGSESLGLSSLAEDASRFVFSTEEQIFNREKEQSSGDGESKFNDVSKHDISVIELEDDVLNKHECMVSLSWLINHMKLSGLIPSEPCDDVAPNWINFLAQSLEDSMTHANIKLFIGRLIVNNAVVLQPYARYLLKPLMKLIVSGIVGRELNYYILDVIITLLSWAPSSVPGENLAYETCELLRFLVKHCDHARREIFRNNMEVIKTIFEYWKDVLEIPYDDIYQKMNDSDSNSKKNLFGIQLLGVVITCNFPPYDIREEARGMSYLNILLKNINHKYKEIHGSAAEVISLILKNIAEKDENIEKNPFFNKVVNHLENLKSQGAESNFLYCLNKIHIGCPRIADKFISKLLFLYPSVYGVYANYILEVLCSRVESIPNAFKELKLIGLFEDMEKKSEPVQFLSLQALEKLIPSLSCDDLLNILPDIVEIHSQPSVQCRFALYKILFVLFETYVNNDGAKEKEITRYAQETLIAGLADPDQSVRLTVDNFWSNEKRLPSSTKERLIALLKSLYSPATEESFLQYATFLLLERTSNSPDYKRKIFEHPLTQCNFQTYQIQVSWRKRHVAMSPIFTETVSNSFLSSSMMGESFGVSKSFAGDGNFVKATQQDYDFPETIDTSKIIKSGTYNWLTEKSVDTFADMGTNDNSFLGSFGGSAEKSYLFALKGSSKTSVKEMHVIPEVKKKEDKKPEHSTVWMLKRRFWKDRGNSDLFAKQELRRQDRRKEILKEQQSRREAQVVIYRNYRIGELPDIEISNSALIAPIQALAMNDVVIARLLLKCLVIGVCNYVEEDCPEEYNTLLSEISSCFGNILHKSYLRTPSVISFCLESLNLLKDVDFDAEYVFVASMGSNQQSIGILLLESKLLKGFDFQPKVKRKRNERQAVSEERNFWMKLAELYKSLNDYDVVNGIFSYTMGHRKENRKALQFEASGHYFDALELYNELYENTSDEYDQAEKDFWDKSILSCIDKLTKWKDLETVVTDRFTEPGTSMELLQLIWQDQYVKDNYLPYWVRSKMKQLLDGKQDQSLLDFFDAAKKDEENKVHFENYAEDLALLYILQEKYDIARQFSSSCLNKFLKDWQNVSPLAVKMQQSFLQNLLKYVELDEFLCLMKNDKLHDSSYTATILKKWQKRYPGLTDPVNVWDDMCCNRQLYLKKLQSEIESKIDDRKSKPHLSNQDSMELCETDDDEQLDFKKLALETSALTKIHFAENASEQKNFPVAIKNLKEIYKVSKSLDQIVWSEFIQCYCSVNIKRCHSLPEKKLDILLQSLKELSDLEVKCGTSVNAKKLQSKTLELVGEMFIKEEIKMSSLSDKNKESIIKVCGSSDQTASLLLERSFLCLKEVINLEKSNEESFSKNTASAHMALANFCNKYLRKEEDPDFSSSSIPSFKVFPVILTDSLLIALEGGIPEAFLLFPRLLQIIELYPDSFQAFKEKVSKMPCWLFIGWINQMVALLDKPEASAVQEIIENISISFPDAIIYSFHLSYENYKFADTVEGKMNKAFVEKEGYVAEDLSAYDVIGVLLDEWHITDPLLYQSLIRSIKTRIFQLIRHNGNSTKIKSILGKQTLITEFVSALEQLSVPSVIFKDYMDDITQLINNKASKQEISSAFLKMYNNLFNLEEKIKSKSLSVGPVQKKFAEDFRKKVLDICGENGHKLGSGKTSDQLATLKSLNDLKAEFAAVAKRDSKSTKLKSFSPWLSNFQPWIYPTQIEIPGQYSGRCKPLPEYHVKIAGFDEKIMVLSSITLPRRIIIRGNDEKEYKILVKAGEDLRQDARIQQMFSVMNEIYQNDVACSQRHISLKTYKVIPLTNRLGLIEWLDNTVVLLSFMLDGMDEQDKLRFTRKYESNAAREKFMQWVKSFKTFPSLYMKLFKEKSREECVMKFQEIAETVPKNLLMKSFLKLSSSPESFVALRTRFATSHAVMCISQWILGIGDRHLGNFLVDKSSGYEIGIDFGHAFGSATQFLAVPELMPFRLTPQYLQLLDPLREKGIYEATMVHTLSALQNKYELLLNMLDIFVKEPTLDWKVFARKQQFEWGENPSDSDWFPKQRIALASKKLRGFNPSYITRDELELGHHSKECYQHMESVCLGHKEHNIRAKYAMSGLSPEEQVDCLIDQATDPHLLCLTYCGWNSWM